MNKVILMGRLTRDPEIRYSSGDEPTAIARYTLAVDRRYKRQGDDQTADFINCVVFGRGAEFAEKYLHQGIKIVVHLNDYALQEAPFRGESADTYNAIKQCIEAVEEQPTAYDVDKVVKQLKERLSLYQRLQKLQDRDCLQYGYKIEATNDAIEIVKAGAKND